MTPPAVLLDATFLAAVVDPEHESKSGKSGKSSESKPSKPGKPSKAKSTEGDD